MSFYKFERCLKTNRQTTSNFFCQHLTLKQVHSGCISNLPLSVTLLGIFLNKIHRFYSLALNFFIIGSSCYCIGNTDSLSSPSQSGVYACQVDLFCSTSLSTVAFKTQIRASVLSNSRGHRCGFAKTFKLFSNQEKMSSFSQDVISKNAFLVHSC